MPHSVRHWAREELERAASNIDWCGTHVVRVAQRYELHHPEIAQPLYTVSQSLIHLQKLVTDIRNSI